MKTIDRMLGHRQGQGGAYFVPEEKSMLLEMRAGLDRERSLTLQVMDDPGTKDLHGQMDWQTATDFKRTGYNLNFSLVEAMSPLKDSEILPDSEEQFGTGLYHSVSKQVYVPAKGDPVERIFKAEDSYDRSSYQNLVGKENYLDKNRPRFAARNLAAQKLQNAMGLKLLPGMEMTCHKGKVGLLMEVARGKQPYNPKTGVARDIPFDAADKPETAARIQKNLIDAEWLDCLCGQQDRHPGNYFIDTDTGQVTMIDNDQAFYPGQNRVENPDPNRRMGKWVPPWPGLPALIDRQTFKRLIALDEKQVARDLSGLLEKQEITATVSRLRQLKQHALKLNDSGKVVDDWHTWRSQEPPPAQVADFLRHRARPQSYFNRAVSDRDRAMSAPARQHTPAGGAATMNDNSSNLHSLDNARELITGSGLPMPRIPRSLSGKLRQPGDYFYFTSRDGAPGPWNLGWFLEEIENMSPENYVVLGLDGHGVESQAAHYYLVEDGIAVFHQSGVASPVNPETDQTLADQYDLIAVMAVASDQAREKGLLSATGRLVIVRPLYLQSFWGIQPAPGQPVDWQDADDPLLDACNWLAERMN